jgi:hypothetical protein
MKKVFLSLLLVCSLATVSMAKQTTDDSSILTDWCQTSSTSSVNNGVIIEVTNYKECGGTATKTEIKITILREE